MSKHLLFCCTVISICLPLAAVADDKKPPAGPVVLLQSTPVGVVQRPDGSYAYFNRNDPFADVVLKTEKGESVPLRPKFAFARPQKARLGPIVLLDDKGELHQVTLKLRGKGRKIGVDRFIDLWHQNTDGGQARWNDATRIWEGYVGALMGYRQLRSGRIIVPFGKWLADRPTAPPTGANVVTAVYSDDRGKTWLESPAQLTSPCFKDYNGANYGACEPVLLEMKDKQLFMLMRTQAGFLYESRSNDGGKTWAKASASRFHSSTGPPGLLKLPDGRIVLFWNNCEMPPKVDGQGVYGGRDALHAAISSDGGTTWRGFREIYRDPFRNDSPPKSGDRGTAYPYPTFDIDGNVVVLSGQGGGRRNFIRFDPDWLTLTTKHDDFRNGLDGWHTFTTFGPAQRYWRDRCTAPELVDHPTTKGKKVMHLRKVAGKPADGATWNFPMGRRGTLTLRLLLKPGFGGCSFALGDRMFEPTDDNGEQLALFRLEVDARGFLGPSFKAARLKTDEWTTLQLRWHLDKQSCRINNGQPLKLQHPTGNGVSYLRIRSTAKATDPHGVLVDSVHVEVDDPVAPARSAKQNADAERYYLKSIARFRNRKP